MYPRPSPLTRLQVAPAQPVTAPPLKQTSLDTPIMQTGLEADIERLHNINSIARKQEVKLTELLPRYRDYLTKQRTSGQKPGAVMVRNMIWAFDADDLDYGMVLATYIHQQGGAVMPENFKRDFPNYILGTVGDVAAGQVTNGKTVTNHITTVFEWMQENPKWDIVDKIRAAVYKGVGGWQEDNGWTSSAIESYEHALTLDSSVGLKRRIAKLKGDQSA